MAYSQTGLLGAAQVRGGVCTISTIKLRPTVLTVVNKAIVDIRLRPMVRCCPWCIHLNIHQRCRIRAAPLNHFEYYLRCFSHRQFLAGMCKHDFIP